MNFDRPDFNPLATGDGVGGTQYGRDRDEVKAILDGCINRRGHVSSSEALSSILQFIMPDSDSSETEPDLSPRRRRLSTFIGTVLNLPENFAGHRGRLELNQQGVNSFEALVRYVNDAVGSVLDENDYEELAQDMHEESNFYDFPRTPDEVNLGLYRVASLDRVLGPSKSPVMLRWDPLVKALRVFSILHAVNENWGALFCSLTSRPLIDGNHFISSALEGCISLLLRRERGLSTTARVPPLLSSASKMYPFALPGWLRLLANRARWNKKDKRNDRRSVGQTYFVPRSRVAEHFADNLEDYAARDQWTVEFVSETGIGEGPTKEFFTEFSRDCQRHGLNLWTGEPFEGAFGTLYSHLPRGLFPSPKSYLPLRSRQVMEAVGLVTARSLCDGRLLDFNFSDAFYRCLFSEHPSAQLLNLSDLVEAAPHVFGLAAGLVDSLREKRLVESEASLSPGDREEALSRITCDGCSFKELCLNFTLPGHENMEMVENGIEIELEIGNVEEYLRLLTWWFLCEGPRESFKALRRGFDRLLSAAKVGVGLQPGDHELLLCGRRGESWTVESLSRECRLTEKLLTDERPVVKFLFEVMSEFSAGEQSLFLKFVTSTPRLPPGGLASLIPKLTLTWKSATGDPDRYLPSANTCNNTIFLVDYSSKEALRDKLILAMREGTGSFDFV